MNPKDELEITLDDMAKDPLIKAEIIKSEKITFAFLIIFISLVYLGITLWLNAIRITAPLWFVWALIVIQFWLYFSIFVVSYLRSKVLGLSKSFAFIIFLLLTILGRINDWELLIIPLVVVVMLILSSRNKKL